jgi:hypothetical protein
MEKDGVDSHPLLEALEQVTVKASSLSRLEGWRMTLLQSVTLAVSTLTASHAR